MAEINIAAIGIVMILLGFMLVFVGALTGKGDSKVAVGGVIGFIPFGFGNDPQLVKIAVIISGVLALLFIIIAIKGL